MSACGGILTVCTFEFDKHDVVECDSDRSSLPVDIVARPRKHDKYLRQLKTHTHTLLYNKNGIYFVQILCDNGKRMFHAKKTCSTKI